MLYGTFSVDILVWRRPHKRVMEIGLLPNFCQSEFRMAQTTVDHFYGMGKYSS